MYVITGASKGIGKCLFEHFLNEGHEVMGFYNSTTPTVNLENYHKLDITDENAVQMFVSTNQLRLKNINLINAAGISYNSFAHKSEMNYWKKVFDTNVIGLFNITRSLLSNMRSDKYGRIISFSSVAAQMGVMGTSAYASSKAALWGLAKSVAVENANKNVTINNINLGYFDIGMIEQVPQLMLDTIIKKIPAERLGKPQEIINTVKFIVDTPYLNGTSIDLNGGLF